MKRAAFTAVWFLAVSGVTAGPALADEVLARINFVFKGVVDCWNPPQNAMPVKVRVLFNRDGTLRDVIPVQPARAAGPSFEAVEQAIRTCVSVARVLPAENYPIWDDMTWTFDPLIQGTS